jgi:hypothetical protein
MAVAPVSTGAYTTIRNISGVTKTFSFLPPHGKRLADNAEAVIAGDINDYFTNNLRKQKAFKKALENGWLLVSLNIPSAEIVYVDVADTTVIAAGDLVYLTAGAVKAAADFTWNTDLATTQAGFTDVFVGVALQSHASGGGHITDFPVDISPASTWTFPCTSETHEIGDTLGPKKAAGNALVSQTLVKSVAASSIARCVKRDTSAATSVTVRIQSAYRGHNAAGAQ